MFNHSYYFPADVTPSYETVVPDAEVREELEYQLKINLKRIRYQYTSFVHCIRMAIKQKETASGLQAYLMSLLAYEGENDEQNPVILSGLLKNSRKLLLLMKFLN